MTSWLVVHSLDRRLHKFSTHLIDVLNCFATFQIDLENSQCEYRLHFLVFN